MGGEASVVCFTSVPTQTGDQSAGMCLQQGVERERKREGKEPHLPDISSMLMLVKSNIGHALVVPEVHTSTTS